MGGERRDPPGGYQNGPPLCHTPEAIKKVPPSAISLSLHRRVAAGSLTQQWKGCKGANGRGLPFD